MGKSALPTKPVAPASKAVFFIDREWQGEKHFFSIGLLIYFIELLQSDTIFTALRT
jgi:hypothetical protein